MLHERQGKTSIAIDHLEGESIDSKGQMPQRDSRDHRLAEVLFSSDDDFAEYMYSLREVNDESHFSTEDIHSIYCNGPAELSPDRTRQLLKEDPGALAILREKLQYLGRELPEAWSHEMVCLCSDRFLARWGIDSSDHPVD